MAQEPHLVHLARLGEGVHGLFVGVVDAIDGKILFDDGAHRVFEGAYDLRADGRVVRFAFLAQGEEHAVAQRVLDAVFRARERLAHAHGQQEAHGAAQDAHAVGMPGGDAFDGAVHVEARLQGDDVVVDDGAEVGKSVVRQFRERFPDERARHPQLGAIGALRRDQDG